VFTLPAAIADVAYQNKAVIYNLMFKVSAETTLIGADPKHPFADREKAPGLCSGAMSSKAFKRPISRQRAPGRPS
jgi:hypothetical protein